MPENKLQIRYLTNINLSQLNIDSVAAQQVPEQQIQPKCDQSLKDKVVIITGAGSGVGKDAAKYLASKGASIVLVDRDENNLDIL